MIYCHLNYSNIHNILYQRWWHCFTGLCCWLTCMVFCEDILHLSECKEVVESRMALHEILWNFLECFGIFQYISECSEIFWILFESSWNVRNLPESFKYFVNFWRTIKQIGLAQYVIVFWKHSDFCHLPKSFHIFWESLESLIFLRHLMRILSCLKYSLFLCLYKYVAPVTISSILQSIFQGSTNIFQCSTNICRLLALDHLRFRINREVVLITPRFLVLINH